jgi:tRNA(Ile)-lysidine synthase TilS/MesJ
MDSLRNPFRRQLKSAVADFNHFKKFVAAVSGAADSLRNPFRRQLKSAVADFNHFKKFVAAVSGA